jgi:hypothetical protein
MTVYPKISNGVSKLGISIGTINLPAVATCRADAPCRKGCYACKGNFTYKTVKSGLQKNLDAFIEDPDRFFNVLHNQLEMIPYKFFRYHSSGDIVNERYLEGMCWLARKHKGTQFLCFTKKYDLVNSYLAKHRLPKNLHLIFSVWKGLECDNPNNLPEAHVFYKDGTTTAKDGAKYCSGNCTECAAENKNCWTLKRGEQILFKEH